MIDSDFEIRKGRAEFREEVDESFRAIALIRCRIMILHIRSHKVRELVKVPAVHRRAERFDGFDVLFFAHTCLSLERSCTLRFEGPLRGGSCSRGR